MAALRSSRSLFALSRTPVFATRTFSTTPLFANASSSKPAAPKDKNAPLSSEPLPIPPTQFPAPNDPFQPEQSAPHPGSSAQYSDTTKKLVSGVAKLMGYNSKASTAIRETGRLMKGIVEAVDKQRDFWYDTCLLPSTYQTFFQVHLLYVLILVTRLRALRANSAAPSPVPEPLDPSAPSGHVSSSNPSISIGPPAHQTYPNELLSHFFELAESQMRMVLGRGERERVIRKYMDEMGEQWKGAGTGLDYALGLGISSDAAEASRSDAELASWAWRNLFASRGINAPIPPPANVEDELKFVEQLAQVTRFVRAELSRLDKISDEDVLSGNIGEWGSPAQK